MVQFIIRVMFVSLFFFKILSFGRFSCFGLNMKQTLWKSGIRSRVFRSLSLIWRRRQQSSFWRLRLLLAILYQLRRRKCRQLSAAMKLFSSFPSLFSIQHPCPHQCRVKMDLAAKTKSPQHSLVVCYLLILA